MGGREEIERYIITPEKAQRYVPPKHSGTVNYLYLSPETHPGVRVGVVVGSPAGPGQGGVPHYHPDAEQIVFVLSGRGLTEIEGVTREIGPGTLIYHPPGQVHRELALTEDFRVLIVYTPPIALMDPEAFHTDRT
jgi:quercetin dioxygenase-like cupin family protein